MAKDLAGKVFLVTGATEGIGKAAALDFAKRGATLALAARSREKGERVVAWLKTESGNEQIELLLADLSRMADVRALAEAFRAKYDRLDVLVNNAGAVFADYSETPDGIETTFALNHVSYFLLTHLLRDVLAKTPGARVVSTASGAHRQGYLDLANVVVRKGKRAGFRAYGDSKLANILFTRELARRLDGTGVTATCFHPGFVESGFAQNNGGAFASLIKLGQRLMARSAEKGAETLIWLATSPDPGQAGGYYHDMKIAKSSSRAKNDDLAKDLWTLSEKICGVA